MTAQIAVLDYGSGNLRSVCRALEHAGAEARLVENAPDCAGVGGLVVPGVGAFDACVQGLNAINGKDIIQEFLDSNKPVLGICVGMQILFSSGLEHGVYSTGLDFFPGKVEKIHSDIVPHMGWNTVTFPADTELFAGISSNDRMYFVHSYGVRLAERPSMRDERVSSTFYGEDFIAGIEKGNLWATQFHPEKSGIIGGIILSNWLKKCTA